MSDNRQWKKDSNNNYRKDYRNDSQIESPKWTGRGKSHSISSSKSRHFSSSRSRSLRKKDIRRRRDNVSISRTSSMSYRSHSEEKDINRPLNPQKGPALDFMIFLSSQIEKSLLENNILKKIEDQVNDVKLYFNHDFIITDLNGAVLHIKGEDIKKKKESLLQLLEYTVKNNLDSNDEDGRKRSDTISIFILVPNGLVSMIIGTKGRQISNLIKETKANIVVNQPIYKMMHRTVSISGKPIQVANAITRIQEIMEERYYEVSKVEMECKPLNLNTTQTHVKFVYSDDIVDYLTSKKGSFINYVQETCSVNIKFYQDKRNKSIERKEQIASFKGTIQSVQDAILLVVKRIQNFIRNTYEGRDSYSLKMLINKVFVTKLIGAQGCMIQEIANFSRGASIKILSNRRMEKETDSNDIIVSIAGSFGAIQDATCIIIEQIECFKKGGPVLKSGKSLNQNIAQQFINSIFCSASRKENEDDHCFTLKERFMSKKRSRSKSRSESRSVSKERKHKRSRHEEENRNDKNNKEDNYDYSNKDPSTNVSYEEKGIIKISTDIIVPDYLVSLLIGKNGECIRGIMNKSGSMINFQKEYNDDFKINTAEGVLGRLCNLKGTPQQNALALQLISEMIIKLESSLNGIRKEN